MKDTTLTMDSTTRDNDVYGLVGQLCESIFRKNNCYEEHPYLNDQDTSKHLRKLKAKTYEILLNKSSQNFDHREPCDPIVELLKYSYVLKTGLGRISQANELEKYLNEFIENKLVPDSIAYLTLQFLNGLKSYSTEEETSLEIFYYGKPHPQLPEMLYDEGSVPPFQIYPIESFFLPKKFEITLKEDRGNVIKYNAVQSASNLALLGQFTLCNSDLKSVSETSYDLNRPSAYKLSQTEMDSTLSSYFLPQIKNFEESEDQSSICKEGIVTEPESPWQSQDPLQLFNKRSLMNLEYQTEIHEMEENDTEEPVNLDKIWEDMDKITSVTTHRTWETLGSSDSPKEPPFLSESVEATLHLINVAQFNILPNQNSSVCLLNTISSKELVNNLKLLLLGIESNTFIYNSTSGFELKKNILVHGIGIETLENMCYEITRWGNCFRNLSNLIIPDPQSGKLQIEGLIFNALCGSIKEFLLFYHAAVLRVFINDDGSVGLLKFLKKVRPLGKLIHKVAGLCCCDSQRLTSLGEGIGILTHIYKEVTKITEQSVALVFYSILKDCCEVYFRFLQHWIFEGVCADIYEEFMIKIRPQYLRTRGHRFWTRAFSINKKTVPHFLSNLADSILQCGKAVTLLKICDPKNPVCRLSASRQPSVKVCLSVGMLREQAKFYENYRITDEVEGKAITLYSAIQEQREAEKKRAELVIAAQQDTLLRLKKEREDALRKIAKDKSKLLEQLKDQAEEAAQRKERDRDAELMADKIFLENVAKLEEEAINNEKAERENTIKYYKELAEEAKRREIHAEWRMKRMKLFDKRFLAISSVEKEFINTPDESKVLDDSEEKNEEGGKLNANESVERDESNIDENSKQEETVQLIPEEPENSNIGNVVISELRPDIEKIEEPLCKDENSNPTSTINNEPLPKNINSNVLVEKNQNIHVSNQENQNIGTEQLSTKAIRPTTLDIANTSTQKNKDFDILDGLKSVQKTMIEKTAHSVLNHEKTDNITEAQRNKLKVLQYEYGFTPNNNESSTILSTIENAAKQSNLTEIQMNRFKNTRHLTHLNWDNVESNDVRKTSDLPDDQLNQEKTEIELNRLRNTQHLTDLNWETFEKQELPDKVKDQELEEKTEIQLNRLRNTQHLTLLHWDNSESNDLMKTINLPNEQLNREKTKIEINRLRNTQHLTDLNWDTFDKQELRDKVKVQELQEKTEIQLNRLRNTQHFSHLHCDEFDSKNILEKQPLTEAQKNKNKVMSHFYNRMDEFEAISVRSQNLTECQINRNKNMAVNIESLVFEEDRSADHENVKDTPMSTTTDHFTTSTYSSSCLQVASCEDTPFSETTNPSDIVFAKSSDNISVDTYQSEGSNKYFQDTPSYPHFIGLLPVSVTPCTESQQLTVADVEMIDTTSLQVYLEKSVIIPLTIQSRLVNNAIIKYLLNEHKMLSHLHSLRSFYFLLNGEFAKTLTQSLFTRLYEVATPKEFFNSSTLNNLLEKALISSISHTYDNSELLSLSVVDVPAYLQTSNPEILSCLLLNYKISWPLNIIFNDIVMQQYSRVFKFLLMVARVFWVLQEDFQILKMERKVAITKNHHRLQLYRHSMMQFMNALHTYLTCSVLHASLAEFEKELEHAKTLDEVYDTHVIYIKKILSRCMLNARGEKMRTCLCNIFKVVLKFHNRIRAQNWSADSKSAGSNYENLERMYLAFCEQRAYLVHVAEKLATSGYQPHLMQFLHALNINHRYDLTKKN